MDLGRGDMEALMGRRDTSTQALRVRQYELTAELVARQAEVVGLQAQAHSRSAMVGGLEADLTGMRQTMVDIRKQQAAQDAAVTR